MCTGSSIAIKCRPFCSNRRSPVRRDNNHRVVQSIPLKEGLLVRRQEFRFSFWLKRRGVATSVNRKCQRKTTKKCHLKKPRKSNLLFHASTITLKPSAEQVKAKAWLKGIPNGVSPDDPMIENGCAATKPFAIFDELAALQVVAEVNRALYVPNWEPVGSCPGESFRSLIVM